jgi:hypothetical protein
MGWGTIFEDTQFSVGIAPQGSDVNTAGSSWVWFECEMPQVSYDAVQYDAARSVSSYGAGSEPLAGREWPRLALKFPVPGQAADWLAGDTATWAGIMDMLSWGQASTTTADLAGEFTLAGSDANTVVCDTDAPDIGCLLAISSSGAVVTGWVESVATLTATLWEDLPAMFADQADRLATLTVYPAGASATSPSSTPAWTIRVVGEDASQDRRYVGCVPASVEYTVENDRLMASVEVVAYGGEVIESSGGLVALTGSLDMEPALGRGGARYTFASNLITSLDDGTADPDGTCDIRDLTLRYEMPHHIVMCPAETQGVNAVVARAPMITATFALPNIDTYEYPADGAEGHILVGAWRNKARLRLAAYFGNEPGKLFAWRIASGYVTGRPERAFIDGVEFIRATVRAGSNAGDTAGRVYAQARG